MASEEGQAKSKGFREKMNKRKLKAKGISQSILLLTFMSEDNEQELKGEQTRKTLKKNIKKKKRKSTLIPGKIQ